MRRVGAVVMACALAACELVTGIQDKTLVAADAGDAGGAGDDAATADPSAPCAQQPGPFLYCDDFDSESSPGQTWDWDLPMGGGSIAFDTANYRSAPQSVQVVTPAAQQAQAQLGKNVDGLTSGFRLAFDLFVDVDPGAFASIPEVGVAQAVSPALAVNYVLGPGALAQAKLFSSGDAAPPLVTLPLRLPPVRGWTRIVLAYDAARGVTVEEDGAPIASSAALALGAPGSTKFIVGSVYANASGAEAPLQVEIDNVVVRGQ